MIKKLMIGSKEVININIDYIKEHQELCYIDDVILPPDIKLDIKGGYARSILEKNQLGFWMDFRPGLYDRPNEPRMNNDDFRLWVDFVKKHPEHKDILIYK